MTEEKRNKKKEAILEAYENTLGNVSFTCKKVKISRKTFYEWCNNDEEFKEKIDEIDESLLDLAETILLKKIKEGSTTELIFFLKTKGKSRGYVEKTEQEISIPNKGSVDIQKWIQENAESKE